MNSQWQATSQFSLVLPSSIVHGRTVKIVYMRCNSTKMFTINVNFIKTLICSGFLFGILDAMPPTSVAYSVLNGTTTAVPLYNVSTTFANNRTPTGTTPVPVVMSDITKSTKAVLTTKTVIDTTIKIPTTQATHDVSPVISMSAADTRMNTGSLGVTTTAAPPSIKPVDSYHHFDGLSFAGGALVALVFVILGSMAWKLYLARIERSYWTL